MLGWLLEVAVVAGRWFEPDYGPAPANWSSLPGKSGPDSGYLAGRKARSEPPDCTASTCGNCLT
jgi:hypothetical protein